MTHTYFHSFLLLLSIIVFYLPGRRLIAIYVHEVTSLVTVSHAWKRIDLKINKYYLCEYQTFNWYAFSVTSILCFGRGYSLPYQKMWAFRLTPAFVGFIVKNKETILRIMSFILLLSEYWMDDEVDPPFAQLLHTYAHKHITIQFVSNLFLY